MNCRAGPLLNLTWKDVATIKKTGQLDTDQNKTRRYYDVTIAIEKDRHKWLNQLKSRFVKEFKLPPDLVFASINNKVEHSMAKNIKTVLSDLFDPNLSTKDFHITSIRKMWDTHFHNNRKKYKDSIFTSHLHQTGHTQGTALQNYVAPPDKRDVLNAYLEELSKLQDQTLTVEPRIDLTLLEPANNLPRQSSSTPRQPSSTDPSSTPRQPSSTDPSSTPRQPSSTDPSSTPRQPSSTDPSSTPRQSSSTQPRSTPRQLNSTEPRSTPCQLNSTEPRYTQCQSSLRHRITFDESSQNDTSLSLDKEELVPLQKLRQKKKGHLTEATPENYDSSGSDFHPEETGYHSDDSCAKAAPIRGKIHCSVGASQSDLFIKSLQSHSNHKPTDDEKRALELFQYVKHGVTKKDVIATIKKAGINFKDPQTMIRLYSKIKFACCTYLREF